MYLFVCIYAHIYSNVLPAIFALVLPEITYDKYKSQRSFSHGICRQKYAKGSRSSESPPAPCPEFCHCKRRWLLPHPTATSPIPPPLQNTPTLWCSAEYSASPKDCLHIAQTLLKSCTAHTGLVWKLIFPNKTNKKKIIEIRKHCSCMACWQ